MSKHPGSLGYKLINMPIGGKIKSFFKWLFSYMLFVIALIFSLMAFNAWHKSAYIEHIWEKVGPVHQLYFIAIMIFAGLYLVNIIARIMTCTK